MSDLTIIIPTYNEELNIVDCISSCTTLNCKVYVIDSYSQDNTKSLAEELNATVIQGEFTTFSDKINWALKNLPITTSWVMRLDADERMTPNLLQHLKSNQLAISPYNAYAIKRRYAFMGKLLRFGGLGSVWDIRLWKHGSVTMESRLLDEHMIVTGELSRLNLEIIDNNNKPVHEWIAKHNNYASSEAKSYFHPSLIEGKSEFSAKMKRFLKNYVYYKMPLFIRPFGNFIYRYIFLFGFLDGIHGFIFHILQSFWYRFLVDVKIYETKINKK